jgi:hypothetical protein
MRWLAIITCLIFFSTLAVTASARRERRAIIVRAATFAYLPKGWEALPQTAGVLTRAGAETESTALSWRYKPNSFGWANRMPRNAIAVDLLLIRRAAGPRINLCHSTPHLPESPKIKHLPLRLPSTTSTQLEGEPNVPEYRIFGRLGDWYNIDLRVDISNPHPTPAMRQRAREVVSHIRFPRWPRLIHC